MTPVLVFDLETIPDIDGLRRLNGWGNELSDEQVVAAAQAARIESHGTDFLPLHRGIFLAFGNVCCSNFDENINFVL